MLMNVRQWKDKVTATAIVHRDVTQIACSPPVDEGFFDIAIV
jgi:hypothetical protein